MKHVLALLGGLVVVFASGCGGGSAGPSPFAGSWTGPWRDTENPDAMQVVSLAVDSTGGVTGSVGVPGSMQSILSGSVSPSGSIDLRMSDVNRPGVPPAAKGNVYRAPDGGLFGSAVAENPTPYAAIIFSLARAGSG